MNEQNNKINQKPVSNIKKLEAGFLCPCVSIGLETLDFLVKGQGL